MPEITEVTDIISTRELVYISAQGIREKAIIEIGKPYKMPEEDGYFCPYRISTTSYERLSGSVGIDSFQALELTLRSMDAELTYWARLKGGSFEFLGEPGTGLENISS